MGRDGVRRVGSKGAARVARCAPKETADREMARVKMVLPMPSIAYEYG